MTDATAKLSAESHYAMLRHNEVRLLKFESATDYANEITLTTHVYTREEAPPYAALSYTWGGEDAHESISLDGKPFFVRPNLYDCLYSLGRYFPGDVYSPFMVNPNDRNKLSVAWYYDPNPGSIRCDYLWIDAICIDQTNVQERNSQVRLMYHTYGNATMVAVWLGVWRSREEDDRVEKHGMEEWTRQEFNHKLGPMLDRPYWSRMWIVQELRMARHIMIFCGPYWSSWGRFTSMAHKLQFDRGDTSKIVANPLIHGSVFGRSLRSVESLEDYLVIYRHSLCQDPRDKVFSLLGLLNEDEGAELSKRLPDYSMTHEEVVKVVLAHIQRKQPEYSPKESYPDHFLQEALMVYSQDRWLALLRETAAQV